MAGCRTFLLLKACYSASTLCFQCCHVHLLPLACGQRGVKYCHADLLVRVLSITLMYLLLLHHRNNDCFDNVLSLFCTRAPLGTAAM